MPAPKPDLPPLKTPKSFTFPSELHKESKTLTVDDIKREDGSATPITPPLAYTDFLNALTPIFGGKMRPVTNFPAVYYNESLRVGGEIARVASYASYISPASISAHFEISQSPTRVKTTQNPPVTKVIFVKGLPKNCHSVQRNSIQRKPLQRDTMERTPAQRDQSSVTFLAIGLETPIS
ncbi:uncharacterized protein N7515_005894 [Penicillium bovifimosum]|uniref:Uncharacterized protein n=1 Tax=Penicillium bovifimosum TaxID=126998 RepID=A0A9W9GTL9_9EURO|nr:uncharacterized protein N7515_005894 [Penicillium bovifimosum]KAJ5129855.1 hypothetical protein N7515_005894 [Penicillium bovifimosum]